MKDFKLTFDKDAIKIKQNFEIKLLDDIKKVVKGSGWRKKIDTLTREVDNNFYCLNIHAEYPRKGLKLTLKTKPMALDELLWDICDMPENKLEPLSFRIWGWYTCTSIIIDEINFDDEVSTPKLAKKILLWSNNGIEKHQKASYNTNFSTLVKKDQQQISHSYHAITLITSLIIEKSYSEAKSLAKLYDSEKLQAGLTFILDDKSYFYLAIKWINKKEKLPSFIGKIIQKIKEI